VRRGGIDDFNQERRRYRLRAVTAPYPVLKRRAPTSEHLHTARPMRKSHALALSAHAYAMQLLRMCVCVTLTEFSAVISAPRVLRLVSAIHIAHL
jgi:hypothetical protein